MGERWGRVWIAIAGMALTAALVANLEFGEAVNLGPLSAWISAAATFGAIVVALKNTDRTLKDSLAREREKRRLDDRRYFESVRALATRALRALDTYWKDDFDSSPTFEWTESDLERMARGMRMSMLLDVLNKLPLHQAPHIHAILAVDMLIAVAHGIERKIEQNKALAALAATKRVRIDFTSDWSSVRWAVDLMEEHLSSSGARSGKAF